MSALKNMKRAAKLAFLTTAAALTFGTNSAKAQNYDELDPNDFWSFSAGYVNAGKHTLYTPTGFYWEGNMPIIAFPKNTFMRDHTALRVGEDLIKQGQFGYSISGVSGNQTYFENSRDVYTEAYGDVEIVQNIHLGKPGDPASSPIVLQPHGSIGAVFSPGNYNNDNSNHAGWRYGFGLKGFAGWRYNQKGIGLMWDVEESGEIVDKYKNNFIPQNVAFERGLHLRYQIGLMLTL